MASPSLAGRALMALVLMVGFYVLALAMAGVLLFIAYATVAHSNRIPIKLVVGCVACAGVILWSILPRIDRFTAPGPRLAPERHPKLFAQLNDVADRVGQRMPAEVYLVPDVNAWVTQRGGIMGIGGRRVMGLGLPLMQVLSVSELRAVLAHEFGHYHGGDTMLGPWVYKTRSAIVRTVQSLGQSFLQKPFLWYGNMFLRITHGVSRQQEFAADALASRTVGSRPLTTGLRAIHGAAEAFDPYWGNEVMPALNAGYRPALALGYARFLQARPVAEIVARSLETEIESGRSDPYDTHPPLRERIEAIADLPPGDHLPHDPPSISLLDDVPGLEAQLLTSMFGHEPVVKLRPVDWEEVGNQVYLPMWEGLMRQHAGALKGITPLAFPRLAGEIESFGDELGKAISKTFSPEEAARYGSAVIGASLSVALRHRGWSIEAPPGDAVTLRPSDAQGDSAENALEPFNILEQLKSGTLTAETWEGRCAALGIGDLDLGAAAESLPPASEPS